MSAAAPGLSQRQTIDLLKDSIAAGAVSELAAQMLGPIVGLNPSGSMISLGTVTRGAAIVGVSYVSGMLVDMINPMLPF